MTQPYPSDFAHLFACRLGRLLAIRDTARRCQDDGWVRVVERLIETTSKDLKALGHGELVEMVFRRYGE